LSRGRLYTLKTTYFETPGKDNTEAAVAAALDRARQLGIKDIVAASNTGLTARALLGGMAERKMDDMNLVVVTHHAGFRSPGEDEMGPETREELTRAGARLLTTTHLFGGVERAVTGKFGGLYPGGLIAYTLRMFGQGVKVAVEVAVMALDAGLVPYGRDVMAVGGTGRGADTALRDPGGGDRLCGLTPRPRGVAAPRWSGGPREAQKPRQVTVE